MVFLKRSGLESGKLLLEQLKLLTTELGIPQAGSRKLSVALNEVHAALLQLDEGLTECLSKPEDADCVEQCRQWLKGLQVFVLALQKDVEYLSKLNISVGTGAAAGCGQHLGLEPQPHPAWNRLLQNAHEKLQRLLVQEGLMYKPVCTRSNLSYNRHWANKHCL